MQDKRTKERGQTNDYFVIFNRETNQAMGRLRNLTSDGIMIITDEPIGVDQIFSCRMHMPDIINGYREIVFDIKCRWCQENKNTFWYEVGFQLVNVPPQSQDIINRLARDWMVYDRDSQSNYFDRTDSR